MIMLGLMLKATSIRVEGKAEEKGTTYVILFCLFFFFKKASPDLSCGRHQVMFLWDKIGSSRLVFNYVNTRKEGKRSPCV